MASELPPHSKRALPEQKRPKQDSWIPALSSHPPILATSQEGGDSVPAATLALRGGGGNLVAAPAGDSPPETALVTKQPLCIVCKEKQQLFL